MKIFTASLEQETNTFSPIPSGLDNFSVVRHKDIEEGKTHFGNIEPFGVWQQKALVDNYEFLFSLAASATPSGTAVRDAYESLRDEILRDLAAAGPVDVVLLLLHGAMVAEGYDDCEGDIITRLREQVGIDTVIAVELDLHCHLTAQMMAGADLIITYKEYPHVDISDRAAELYDLAVATKQTDIHPTMALFDCKMIGLYPTTNSDLRKFIDSLFQIEQRNEILSVSFIHGFPWGDVKEGGSKMLVVTDNNQQLATSLAQELGLKVFSLRHSIGFDSLPMEEALSLAVSRKSTPVVVADQSDNIGGGAPGDATYALRWLLDHQVQDAAIAILYDPEVVKLAQTAGEGARLLVRLGGKMGAASGEPLDLTVSVGTIRKKYLHKCPQQSGAPIKIPAGDVVALHCQGIDIVVSSERCQCFSPCIFEDLGVNPLQKRLLIPKSIQHFYEAFAPIAAEVIYMAAPGAIVPIMQQIPYQKMATGDKFPWIDNPHNLSCHSVTDNQHEASSIKTNHQHSEDFYPGVFDKNMKSYQARLAAWERARFAPRPEQPLNPTRPTRIEMVPMRDKVRLYTEIFLPPRIKFREGHITEVAPVVLVRSPYPVSRPSRNDKHLIPRYLTAGYAFVFQLTRGQGQSEGCYQMLRDDIDDGYDTIQWLAEQPWCNGRVGMQGASYIGSTQLMAARAKPPALKCIMPTAFVGNYTQSFPFSCGVPNKGPYMQWHQVLDAERWDDMDVDYCDMSALNHPKWGPAFRKRPLVNAADEVLSNDKLASWQETISNPIDNEYWQPLHFTDKELAELDLPIFFTDGWYDMTIGPIDYFTRLEQIQPERVDRYLLVGPWDHYQTFVISQPGQDNNDRILPSNGAIDLVAQRLAFFDRYLKEDTTSVVQEERVKVYITGAPDSAANVWKHFSTFPAPGTEYKSLYLHSQGNAHAFPSDGVLGWEAPGGEPTDHYTYDPTLPTASQVETSRDRRQVEIRSDVLTYTSEPFHQPLTILGEIKLTLYAASDAPDTDWFAVLTEVFPDGQSKSFHYARPAFRARYRKGFSKEVFLTPNKSEEFRIPLGPAGHQIAASNRLRLSIFSAAFPEYDPNTNTGNPAAIDTEMQIAQQTVFHDARRPSHILLPVIELGSI